MGMESESTLKQKKIPVIRVILFLALSATLFVFASYLFRPVPVDRRNVAGYYMEQKNTLDAVYIGGSACFVYWAPMIAWREYGIASYNFGCNTMPADALKYCIDEVLKTQSPKLIILDIRPFQYRDSEQPDTEVSIRNVADSMKYSLNREMMIENIVPTVLHMNTTEFHIDFGKYHGRWKELSYTSFNYVSNELKNPYKGFFFVPKTNPEECVDLRGITKKTPVSRETNAILLDLLKYCKTLKQKVLFVTNSYSETERHREVYNYLKDEVAAAGFDYINTNDYNNEIGMDYSTDLYNENHVNILGAEKFTRFLAKFIDDKYSLPDKRNDPLYRSWDADYIEWENAVTKTKETIESQLEN